MRLQPCCPPALLPPACHPPNLPPCTPPCFPPLLPRQDSPFGAAEEVGRSLLVYGRAMPKAELFARIDAVDAATVKAVAQRIILDQVGG